VSLRLLFATGVMALAAGAQMPQPQSSSAQPSPANTPPANTKPEDPKHAQLRADSARLAKAAAELKAMLARTNPDTMSLDVMKKAQEVQDLAKLVQKEMKQQ
jgi:hypothetical protein